MKCHRCSRMHSGDTSKVLSKQVCNCLRVCYCSLIKGYNRCGRCRILSRYFLDSDEDLGGWCANCDGRDNSSKTPAEPSLRCSGHGHELVKKSPNNGRPHDTVEGKKKSGTLFLNSGYTMHIPPWNKTSRKLARGLRDGLNNTEVEDIREVCCCLIIAYCLIHWAGRGGEIFE